MLQSCDKVVLYVNIIMYLVYKMIYSHSVAIVIDILLSGHLKWSLKGRGEGISTCP